MSYYQYTKDECPHFQCDDNFCWDCGMEFKNNITRHTCATIVLYSTVYFRPVARVYCIASTGPDRGAYECDALPAAVSFCSLLPRA